MPNDLTSARARRVLDELVAERATALGSGLAHNVVYMDDLEADLEAARETYVGPAVSEIATLRGELFVRQVAELRLAAGPHGDPLRRQADLRRDEPRRVVLILRPDVPYDDDRAIALDRPSRLLGRRLERRSVLSRIESLGQGHVEQLGPRRMVGLCHAASLALCPPRSARASR